jgi:hypothetical protein
MTRLLHRFSPEVFFSKELQFGLDRVADCVSIHPILVSILVHKNIGGVVWQGMSGLFSYSVVPLMECLLKTVW